MFKKISISMALLACLAFSGLASAAAADPSLHEVYQAAQAGRVNEAQDMMKQVLRDHPNSGKAHYVVAELDAKQGKTAAAAEELATAERLAPGLPFAKPESVQSLRSVIARGSNTASTQRPAAVNQAPVAAGNSQMAPAGGLPWGGIVIGILVILAGFMLFRRMMRRQQQVMMPAPMYGGGPGGGVQGFGQGGPGYGPNGPAPGYGPNYNGGVQQPGMGSGLMGSLATGAAMGAGVVAGQALMHRFTDGGNSNNNGGNAPVDNSSWNAPADNNMGGSDFGIADNSSWDSGGGGGGDSGGGGGSDDWS